MQDPQQRCHRGTRNFETAGIIGKGSYSTVYRAIHYETSARIAVKNISKRDLDSEDYQHVYMEQKFHRSLRHPNIVSLFGYEEDEENLWLIMELVEGSTLLDVINTSAGISEDQARILFVQLLSAVNYIHTEKSAIHRDIKLENIMISTKNEVKLIDFGFCNQGQGLYETFCGSYPYAAPELLAGAMYSQAVDIWSCGVVLYSMICANLPFNDENVGILIEKIKSSEPIYPSSMSHGVKDLLKRMLEKNPTKRIDLKDIINHPWVNKTYRRSMGAPCDEKMFTDIVGWQMRQLGRNPNVDTEANTDDAITYRILMNEASKISKPVYERNPITESQILPEFTPMGAPQRRRQFGQKTSATSSQAGYVPLKLLLPTTKWSSRNVTKHMPLACETEVGSRSMQLPGYTFKF